MRWFVDVNAVGKPEEKQRYCVESDSWQRALQAARGLRNDPGPMTGFSIELLDDGFSAVDPVKRLRYAIRKTEADHPLTVGDTPSHPPPAPRKSQFPPAKANSTPPPSSARDGKARSSRPPAPELKLSPKTKGKTPSPAKTQSNRPASHAVSPPQAEVAPVSQAAPAPASAQPSSPAPASGDVVKSQGAPADAELPEPLDVIAKREQDPGPDGPLTYREYAYLVEGTPPNTEAEKLLRQELERVKRSIADARSGKLVNLALFNVRFAGRPPKLPLATLTWKDWKEDALVTFPASHASQGGASKAAAPEVRIAPLPAPVPVTAAGWGSLPLATNTVRMSIDEVPMPDGPIPVPADLAALEAAEQAKAAKAAPPASVSSPKSLSKTQMGFPAPTPFVAPAPTPVTPAPEVAPPPAVVAPPEAPPVAAAPAVLPPPPAASVVAAEPAPVSVVVAPEPAPVSVAPVSAVPATQRAPASVRPVSMKRLRGDELIADLFESMHDLQFLRDSIEGAEFCLTLALEKMPAFGGIVHLYDINRREFVITCAGGAGGESLLAQRSAENDPILAPTMRKRRPLVLADATTHEAARSTKRYTALGGARSLIVAPVAVGGRFLGAIELLNPIDKVPFTNDDGHALAYIAEQLAAFVSQRGIVLEREKSAPPPPAKTGRSAATR